MNYIVATRPSLLAYTQTLQTVELIKSLNSGSEFEIVKITTHGDNVTDRPLTEFGGTGVFVKELEKALLDGKAHFAVHSLKDVPSDQPEGLTLACFPKREDPRDVFLTKDNLSLSELKDNCTIGTGSPRRIVQISNKKPNTAFKDLRGNIETRLRKLEEGQYDAIVLAAAGLNRLGKVIPSSAFLSVETCVPAVGQGAIAIECREDNEDTFKLLRSVNDIDTETAITAERSFMLAIGGGCKFPLAAHATVSNNEISMVVLLGNDKTGQIIKHSGNSSVSNAVRLGILLADKVKADADKLGIKYGIE